MATERTGRLVVIGACVILIAGACTTAPGAPAPTAEATATTAAETTSSTIEPPPTSTTSPSPVPDVDLPRVITATPAPAAPGDVIEICAGFPDGTTSFIVARDVAGYSANVSLTTATQTGPSAACWEVQVPERLASRTSTGMNYHPTPVGTLRLLAYVDDQIVGEGRISITDGSGSPSDGPPAKPWTAERYLIGQPLPIAISAASAGWNLVVPHGNLDEVVDVASPQWLFDEYPRAAHLWTDPDQELQLLPSELFSVATGPIVWREFDFEVGHGGMVADARTIGPPPMSVWFSEAIDALGGMWIPYLQHVSRGDGRILETTLYAHDDASGRVVVLGIEDATDAPADPGYPSDPSRVSASATFGDLAVQLSVISRVPQGDGASGVPPDMSLSVGDAERMLTEVIEAWTTNEFLPPVSMDGLWISLVDDVVRRANRALHGPSSVDDYAAGFTSPMVGRSGVLDTAGEIQVLYIEDALDAASELATADTRIDTDGSTAVFVTSDAQRFFCFDTAFRIDADIEFVRELASAICTSVDPTW